MHIKQHRRSAGRDTDNEILSFMDRKLKEESSRHGLEINTNKFNNPKQTRISGYQNRLHSHRETHVIVEKCDSLGFGNSYFHLQGNVKSGKLCMKIFVYKK